MMVMAALSTSVVLTYAFIQTQTVSINVNQNVSRRDLVGQAAQSGAAAALQAMQSATWSGVNTVLTAVIQSDNAGTLSYEVHYLPVASVEGRTRGADVALQVRIQSTGRWQSAAAAPGASVQTVERQVEVVAKLQPRVPGRPLRTGDYAPAEDLAPNPTDYDTIQTYAVFAKGGSDHSLDLDPGCRIEGNFFLRLKLNLFLAPAWGSNSIRDRVLRDLSQRFVTTVNGQVVVQHPHPVGGTLTFAQDPGGAAGNDYSKAGIPYVKKATQPNFPSINFNGWLQYQLYANGFTYNAQQISPSLGNITLRPSLANPLGIYYASGSVTLNSDVTLQGTLITPGTVTISGQRVQVTSYNWRGASGTPLVTDIDLWPRLPAIVADTVVFDRNTTAIVEGAVVVAHNVNGAGGRLEYTTVPDVTLTGTATSVPVQQPWSVVQLAGTPNLSNVTATGDYAIWLQRGSSGGWYPITGVDTAARTVTVLGEVRNDTPTSFTIRRARQRFVSIRGPLSGDSYALNHNDDWNLTSTQWSLLYTGWQAAVAATPPTSTPPLFTEWLANPLNFVGWATIYTQVGLPLEPTFHARSTPSIYYLWSPPLFQPYQTTDSTGSTFAGYRWKVISWRELN